MTTPNEPQFIEIPVGDATAVFRLDAIDFFIPNNTNKSKIFLTRRSMTNQNTRKIITSLSYDEMKNMLDDILIRQEE